ncbi:MAG: DEAD/DEAH box helicase [Chloroflexota bacterium]|nr:DEAD/DEAH box helicase [Chloroflexota bacterium]
MHETVQVDSFEQLNLSEPLLQAVRDVGYESPTPIQMRSIPPLLEGRDLIGQAQTGTGKTAAFAFPILERLELDEKEVQALVLTPTRELALQVAEAIHTYSKHVGQVYVLPVYGGQAIEKQLRRLRQGVHIVVGTPGRIMDHLRRGTLNFDALQMVVLDEADEMLRMGFLEDVEWILSQAPDELQIALFSATMPQEIRRIADRYLEDPVTVEIEQKALTVPTIEQRYLQVSERNKLDALTRILEIEVPEAVLIFTRTKVGAAELAEKLQARGYAAEPMHGDMSQSQRESVINRLRRGQIEIVVATDVAARGWDVEQISHVINYDIPYDTESYVHRIGRTGRAGREGVAILFVTPRQQRMLRDIERYTRKKIEPMRMPTKADVASRRLALFKEQILDTLRERELDPYLIFVEELAEESGCDMAEIAAAAARLARGDQPLAVMLEPEPEQVPPSEDGMVRLFIDAGRKSGVRPSDIVGAIANEADIPGKSIGAIDIYDRFTFVDVPAQYADQVVERMRHASIRQRDTDIRRATPRDEAREATKERRRKGEPKGRRGFRRGGKKSDKRR